MRSKNYNDYVNSLIMDGSNRVKLDSNNKILLKGNLQAVWEMTEGSGTTMYDSTANNIDGTIGSAVTLNAGSYSFIRDVDSGVSIDSPSLLSLGSKFTINCWVNPHSNALYLSDTPFIIYLYMNSTCRVHMGLTYNSSTTANLNCTLYTSTNTIGAGGASYYATGTGFMGTAVCDGINLTCYHNTTAESIVGTYAGNFNLTPTFIRVGSSATNYLYATVNQLAVWDRALTADELSTLYNGGAGLAYASWPASLKD